MGTGMTEKSSDQVRQGSKSRTRGVARYPKPTKFLTLRDLVPAMERLI